MSEPVDAGGWGVSTYDLQAIKRAAELATKGPWTLHADRMYAANPLQRHAPTLGYSRGSEHGTVGVISRLADAQYLALCDPATLLALVVAVEAAQTLMENQVSVEGSHRWNLVQALAPFTPPEARHG